MGPRSLKIPILNDLHLGIKSENKALFANQKKFFNKVFFPYCVEHDVDNVIIAGDVFDDRNSIGLLTMDFASWLIRKFQSLSITVHMIPGNHDVKYRDTNAVNSLEPMFSRHEGFHVYMNPVDLTFDHATISLVPWINKSNEEETLDFIANSLSDVIITHAEYDGMRMPSGHILKGLDPSLFEKFTYTLNGHIHSRSTHKSVVNLGLQYQLTWGNLNSPIGFRVLDCSETDIVLETIDNPHRVFWHIEADENQKVNREAFAEWVFNNSSKLKGALLRVSNFGPTDDVFKDFVRALNQCELSDLKIEHLAFDATQVDDDPINEDVRTIDALSLIKEEIDMKIDNDMEKVLLNKALASLSVAMEEGN